MHSAVRWSWREPIFEATAVAADSLSVSPTPLGAGISLDSFADCTRALRGSSWGISQGHGKLSAEATGTRKQPQKCKSTKRSSRGESSSC